MTTINSNDAVVHEFYEIEQYGRMVCSSKMSGDRIAGFVTRDGRVLCLHDRQITHAPRCDSFDWDEPENLKSAEIKLTDNDIDEMTAEELDMGIGIPGLPTSLICPAITIENGIYYRAIDPDTDTPQDGDEFRYANCDKWKPRFRPLSAFKGEGEFKYRRPLPAIGVWQEPVGIGNDYPLPIGTAIVIYALEATIIAMPSGLCKTNAKWTDELVYDYGFVEEDAKYKWKVISYPVAQVEPTTTSELNSTPAGIPNTRMVVCDLCGNKRCPHAADHRYKCTESNEPNQIGEPIK